MNIQAAVKQKKHEQIQEARAYQATQSDLLLTILGTIVQSMEEQLSSGQFYLDHATESIVLTARANLYTFSQTDIHAPLFQELSKKLPKTHSLHTLHIQENTEDSCDCFQQLGFLCSVFTSCLCFSLFRCLFCFDGFSACACEDSSRPHIIRAVIVPVPVGTGKPKESGEVNPFR